jgi:hypothetical protein
MNDTITLTVLGNPKALKRHRTYTHDAQGKPLRFPRKVDASATDKAGPQRSHWRDRLGLTAPLFSRGRKAITEQADIQGC